MVWRIQCNTNELTSLDLTENTALRTFTCEHNNIASLDLTKNTQLENLSCDYNKLTLLDVTKCPSLKTIYCTNNELTSLDLSQNRSLTGFSCNYNHLTSFDMSQISYNTTFAGARGTSPQNVSIGDVYTFKANKQTYYFIWLQDDYKFDDDTFEDRVHVLDGTVAGTTTSTFKPYDQTRVTWKNNCEVFHGTAQNNSSNGPRRALSDGLEVDQIYGDILLLDSSTNQFTYDYNINLTTSYNNTPTYMTVNVGWTGASPTTGIDEAKPYAWPAGVKFVNTAGVISDTPWPGVNIVVTTMDDGTQQVEKQLR